VDPTTSPTNNPADPRCECPEHALANDGEQHPPNACDNREGIAEYYRTDEAGVVQHKLWLCATCHGLFDFRVDGADGPAILDGKPITGVPVPWSQDDDVRCCDQWPTCEHNLDLADPPSPDLEGAIDRLAKSIDDRVFIVEEDWARLMALLASVEETAAEYETCKKASADAKKDHEAAQAALQRALARMRDGQSATNAPTLPFDGPAAAGEQLPHGGVHQSDVVQAAHDDPAVVTLTNRLLAIRWDVTPELVAGWTVDERAQLTAWLDGMGVGERPALAEGQPEPGPMPLVEYYERDNGIDAGDWRYVKPIDEDGSQETTCWQFRNDANEEWHADPAQEQIDRWWREGRLVPIYESVPELPESGPARDAVEEDRASER